MHPFFNTTRVLQGTKYGWVFPIQLQRQTGMMSSTLTGLDSNLMSQARSDLSL